MQFLSGGGELGSLIRAKDWSKTTLGTPDTWPQSLRTTISIVLNSRFPMFIFWGPDLICFYNDAYRPSLGNNGKHPEMLGEKAENYWQEIWHIIKPFIDQVLVGGEAVWSEDQLIPIYRNNKLENVYWTFSYSAVKDESDKPAGVIVTCSETTGKVNALLEIKEREQQLNFTIEAAELGTWDLNPVTNKFTGNSRLKEWFGLKKEDEIDLTKALDVIIDRDRQSVIDRIKYSMEYASGGDYEIQYTIVSPVTNITRLVLAKGKALFDENNKVYKFSGILQDITRQKIAEKEIARFKFMADNATDAFILIREDGSFAYLNKLALHRWGYTEEEAKTINITDINPFFTAEMFKLQFQQAQKESISQYESFHKRKNGELFPVEINMGSIIFDHTPYVFGIARDISKRKKTEEELKMVSERFRLLADSMPQHIWTASSDGKLNYFNKSVYDFSGFSKDELDSKGWLEIVHPDDRDKNIILWNNAVQTGSPFLFEHRFKRADGIYRWQLSRAIPQKDLNGNIQMWVGTSTDIHDHRLFTDELERQVQQRTEQLRQSNEDLIRSNNELAQFSYVASHDLQEPLRKIQTFSNRILEMEADNLSEKGKDYFKRMQSASLRMQQLILDLLSYSRANISDKNFQETDLNEILNLVKDQFKDLIEQKEIKIINENLPVLQIIPFQFEQLFTNILSNSVKFSKDDTPLIILINAENINGKDISHSDAEDISYFKITISDNGIGFDPEFNERVFNLFQRLHGKDEYQGTGIGLAICKKIVENYKGIITAIGEPDKGATFNIYLPV